MSERPPPNPNVGDFNNLYWLYFGQNLNVGQLDNRYLKFPVSQGSETINGNFDVLGLTEVSSQGIKFDDGTVQTTAGGAAATPTLNQCLTAGNNAGPNDMDMNNQSILNVFDIATQTVTASGAITGLSANITNTISATIVNATNVNIVTLNTITVNATNIVATGVINVPTLNATNVVATGVINVPTANVTNIVASGTITANVVNANDSTITNTITANVMNANDSTITNTISATNMTASNSMTTGTLNYTTLNPPIPAPPTIPFGFATSTQSATQFGTTGAGYIAGQKLTFGGTWSDRDFVLVHMINNMTWNGTSQLSRGYTSGVLQLKPFYMPSGTWSGLSAGSNIRWAQNAGDGSSGAYVGQNNASFYEADQNAGSIDLFKLYGNNKSVQFIVQSPGAPGGFTGQFALEYLLKSTTAGTVSITLGNDGTSVYSNNSLP